MSSSSSLWGARFFLFPWCWGTPLSGGLGGRHCKHDFLEGWGQDLVFKSRPRDSAEVGCGGAPEPSGEFVGLALLTEEYPEVVPSLPGPPLQQAGERGARGPRRVRLRAWHRGVRVPAPPVLWAGLLVAGLLAAVLFWVQADHSDIQDTAGSRHWRRCRGRGQATAQALGWPLPGRDLNLAGQSPCLWVGN